MPPEQNYANHRRFHPVFHFFVVPVLAINVLVTLYNVWRYRATSALWQIAWSVLVSIAIVLLALLTRFYALRQQDRLIRLEETLRLRDLLPADLKPRINELRTAQLIGLRYCSDEELPEATRAVLAGEVKSPDEIKRRVKQWRPDYHRI
jgi:hypothetical protein